MDLVMTPVRVATSKPARQTYVNTILFLIASGILLCLAAVAYILFYMSYVPQIGIEKVVHLQYGVGPHPYGITQLSNALISQQPYDITLSIHVPRSPPNLNRGNFMLSLALLPSTYVPSLPTTEPLPIELRSPLSTLTPHETIYTSRRPALLTYKSSLLSLSTRLLSLPLYILRLRSESEILSITLGESVSFAKGWKNVPAYALVEVQAGQDLQVYDVRLLFRARFGGLRWIMYNHRIISFIVFTGAFWLSECFFAALAWLVLGGMLSSPARDAIAKDNAKERTIKSEQREERTDDEPDLSDTPRTFPTYGRQPPLKFVPKVKHEEIDSEEYLVENPNLKIEADDEDEEEGGFIDSGMGTSFSDGTGGAARRRSRVGRRSG